MKKIILAAVATATIALSAAPTFAGPTYNNAQCQQPVPDRLPGSCGTR